MDSKNKKTNFFKRKFLKNKKIKPTSQTVGYKILKVYADTENMARLTDYINYSGIKSSVVEDGMPSLLTEIKTPNFTSFVCIDIENSGSFGIANGDIPSEITEIACVKVIKGKIVDRKDWLCNPGRSIVPTVKRLTHITNEMVQGKPKAEEIIDEVLKFIGDMPVVGHNIKYSDLIELSHVAARKGILLELSYFDTFLYAEKLKSTQSWERLKLKYLTSYYGIEHNDNHRAYSDAEANALLYLKLRKLPKPKED